MKKIMVCIFVVISLCLSYKLYLRHAFSFSANIESEKPFVAQVFYTEKDNKSFNEKQSIKKDIKAGKNGIVIDFPAKRIKKFRFDFGAEPGTVKISDMVLSGNKKIQLDTNNFGYNDKITKSSVSNGEITIVSKEQDPYMVYKSSIDLRRNVDVNWFVLFILFCVYWFTFSKIIDYLCKINNGKKYSWSDLVFIVMFFMMLFIPMLYISNAEKSEQENRMLSKKPEFIVDGDINSKYGTQFNDWFNDRFLGRNVMTNIHNTIKFGLNKTYCSKEYCLIYDFIKRIYGPYVPSSEELEQDKEALLKLEDFCKKEKIICYFTVLPEREPFLPDAYTLPKPYLTHVGLLADVMKDSETGFIDFTPVLFKADKIEPVFFKTDHHWTDWGAWNAYKFIANKLKNTHGIILPTEESDYKISYNNLVRAEYEREYTNGILCKNLNMIKNCPLKYQYKYYDLPSHIKRKNRPKDGFAEFENGKATNKKIVIIGTSMTENITPFFTQGFKHVYKFRANFNKMNDLNMSRWVSDIKTIKPQVLIFVVQSDFLKRLKDMWKE